MDSDEITSKEPSKHREIFFLFCTAIRVATVDSSMQCCKKVFPQTGMLINNDLIS